MKNGKHLEDIWTVIAEILYIVSFCGVVSSALCGVVCGVQANIWFQSTWKYFNKKTVTLEFILFLCTTYTCETLQKRHYIAKDYAKDASKDTRHDAQNFGYWLPWEKTANSSNKHAHDQSESQTNLAELKAH